MDNSSIKNHVKFGHFVNLSYIFFGKNVLPLKLTELAPTPMLAIINYKLPTCLHAAASAAAAPAA